MMTFDEALAEVLANKNLTNDERVVRMCCKDPAFSEELLRRSTRPEAVECLRDILDCPQETDANGYVQYTVPIELVKKAIASLPPQPSVP